MRRIQNQTIRRSITCLVRCSRYYSTHSPDSTEVPNPWTKNDAVRQLQLQETWENHAESFLPKLGILYCHVPATIAAVIISADLHEFLIMGGMLNTIAFMFHTKDGPLWEKAKRYARNDKALSDTIREMDQLDAKWKAHNHLDLEKKD